MWIVPDQTKTFVNQPKVCPQECLQAPTKVNWYYQRGGFHENIHETEEKVSV